MDGMDQGAFTPVGTDKLTNSVVYNWWSFHDPSNKIGQCIFSWAQNNTGISEIGEP